MLASFWIEIVPPYEQVWAGERGDVSGQELARIVSSFVQKATFPATLVAAIASRLAFSFARHPKKPFKLYQESRRLSMKKERARGRWHRGIENRRHHSLDACGR